MRAYALLDGDVRVPAWPKDRAVLGDLVIGYGQQLKSGEPVYRAFRFGHRQVFPNPAGVYAIGDTLVLAIEAKGAPEGSQLRFRVSYSDLDPAYQEGQPATIDETIPLAESGPVIRELLLDGAKTSKTAARTCAAGRCTTTSGRFSNSPTPFPGR